MLFDVIVAGLGLLPAGWQETFELVSAVWQQT